MVLILATWCPPSCKDNGSWSCVWCPSLFFSRALHVPAASWSSVSLRGNPWDDDLHHLASWRTRVNATTDMHPSVCIVKQDVSLADNTFRNKPRGRASRGAKIYKADYALILHRDSFPSCRRAEAKGKAWCAGLHSAGNKAEDKKGRSKSKLEISWLAMRSRRTRRSNQFTRIDSLELNYLKVWLYMVGIIIPVFSSIVIIIHLCLLNSIRFYYT